MFLLVAAAALVILGALLRLTEDDVLQTCGLWSYGLGMGIAVIALSVSCASPTAPSATYRLTFAKAPGCEPGELPKQPSGDPIALLNLPGTPLMNVVWIDQGSTLRIDFKQVGPLWLICAWGRA